MKRILIVNVVLVGEESGTGHTLENIFCDYPQANIMQLSLQIKPERYKTTIKNTMFINKHCIPVDNAFRNLFTKLRIKKKNIDNNSVISATIPQKNVKGALHDFVRGLLDMSFISLDSEIISCVNAFSPDVIYTCGCTIRIHKVVNYLSKKFQIPIILHLMDDWPETVYTSSFLSCFARRKIHSELIKTNLLSITNFAISEALCQKYEKKFRKPYIPLMNPAKHIVTNAIIEDKEIVNFIYAGSLSLNRWKSLLQIAEVIYDINRTKKCASLKLYIPEDWNNSKTKEMFSVYDVEINNYLSNEKVSEVYDKADVLIHVESFDENYKQFTKYSLSTKIPEYMGAGKPILAYLPKELHGGNYITENNAGLVANDMKELKRCIVKMVKERACRHYFANGGIISAKEKHSIESVRLKLYKVLEKA